MFPCIYIWQGKIKMPKNENDPTRRATFGVRSDGLGVIFLPAFSAFFRPCHIRIRLLPVRNFSTAALKFLSSFTTHGHDVPVYITRSFLRCSKTIRARKRTITLFVFPSPLLPSIPAECEQEGRQTTFQRWRVREPRETKFSSQHNIPRSCTFLRLQHLGAAF